MHGLGSQHHGEKLKAVRAAKRGGDGLAEAVWAGLALGLRMQYITRKKPV